MTHFMISRQYNTGLGIEKQISGKERPEITPSIYGQLIFDKSTRPFNGNCLFN